jgi:PAS domain S-box-containing protein
MIKGRQGTFAELVVPIVTNRGIFALMHLQRGDNDSFQERDMRILNAFAQHMAVAAENFQLYQTMQRHNTELEDAIVQRTVELRRAKEDVESILNSTSDAIAVLDMEGRIVNCNPAFEASFGIEADEAYRQQMALFFTTESQSTFQMLFNRLRSNGTLMQAELLAEWQQGLGAKKEPRVVEVSLSQVERVDDDNVRVVCSVHDISRHKDLMITLQRALDREHELNDMKGQFLSVATHEFRTPLTSIALITGTLQDYWEQLNEQKIKGKLSSIQDQVKRMTALIDDVLTLGQSEAGEWPFSPCEINLPELLSKLGAEWQSALASQHQLFIACSGTEETLYADPDLLEHILINLVSNAVKYSLPGSQIKIKAQLTESNCLIEVIDQGIGIPEQEQSKLFESFYRASNARKMSGVSGTGLGLVIVKRAAEMHGGDIDFVSVEGQGTVFTVRIPRIATKTALNS